MTGPRDPLRPGWALLAACLGATTGALAENVDPLDDGSQFAYAENVGWLNAEPSGPGGPGLEVGDLELTGWLWGENVGWISLSCENTSSCATVAYGVVNDGEGVLSGYAWGENTGWINFAPSTSGVTIDTVTGSFGGRAWGENVGWITFASTGPVAYKVQTDWCVATLGPPTGSPVLTLADLGADTELSWAALPSAGWYDVVRGDLGSLRSTGGNFTASTQACVADNTQSTSLSFPLAPAPGEGFWFLVRAANCKGPGVYDSGAASQIGSRDAEIAASGPACP